MFWLRSEISGLTLSCDLCSHLEREFRYWWLCIHLLSTSIHKYSPFSACRIFSLRRFIVVSGWSFISCCYQSACTAANNSHGGVCSLMTGIGWTCIDCGWSLTGWECSCSPDTEVKQWCHLQISKVMSDRWSNLWWFHSLTAVLLEIMAYNLLDSPVAACFFENMFRLYQSPVLQVSWRPTPSFYHSWWSFH